jgi:hypothetical protein
MRPRFIELVDMDMNMDMDIDMDMDMDMDIGQRSESSIDDRKEKKMSVHNPCLELVKVQKEI